MFFRYSLSLNEDIVPLDKENEVKQKQRKEQKATHLQDRQFLQLPATLCGLCL